MNKNIFFSLFAICMQSFNPVLCETIHQELFGSTIHFFLIFILIQAIFFWLIFFFNTFNLIIFMIILEILPIFLLLILYTVPYITIESYVIFFFILLLLAGEAAFGLAILISKSSNRKILNKKY